MDRPQDLVFEPARSEYSEERIQLAAQFLLYPMLDVSTPHAAYSSHLQFGGSECLLTYEGLEAAASWYLERASTPGRDSHREQRHDPLLDEANLHAERLMAAAVPMRPERFETRRDRCTP